MHHSPKGSLSGLQHDELQEPILSVQFLLHVQLYQVLRGPDGGAGVGDTTAPGLDVVVCLVVVVIGLSVEFCFKPDAT